MTILDQDAPPLERPLYPPEKNESVLDRVMRQAREIADPFVQQLTDLDQEIAAKEAELKELRQARQIVRGIVKGIDPSLVEPIYRNRKPAKAKKKESGKSNDPSPMMVDRLFDWLEAHRDELNGNGGFRAVDLSSHEDFDAIKSPSAVNKTLLVLHEQGRIRLDRWVRGRDYPEKPTGKFYKVV